MTMNKTEIIDYMYETSFKANYDNSRPVDEATKEVKRLTTCLRKLTSMIVMATGDCETMTDITLAITKAAASIDDLNQEISMRA